MCTVSAQGLFSQHLGEHYLIKAYKHGLKATEFMWPWGWSWTSLSSLTEKTKNVALHFIYLWLLMEIGPCCLIAATGCVWIQQCWCESDTRVAQCNEKLHLLITHPLKRRDVIMVFPSGWLLVVVRHYSAWQTTIRLDMQPIQFHLQYKKTKNDVAILVLSQWLLCRIWSL